MQCWGLTDPGCVRPQNQDVFHIEKLDGNTNLCVVCDGMGGAKSGNVASSLAAEVFVQEVRRNWKSGLDNDRIDQSNWQTSPSLTKRCSLKNSTAWEQPWWRRWSMAAA